MTLPSLPITPLLVDSLYFLGLLKLYGISVSPDAGKALEYMRKAAELRHLEAMAALGVMLLHGRGDWYYVTLFRSKTVSTHQQAVLW